MKTKTTIEQEIKSLRTGHCLGIIRYIQDKIGTERIEERPGRLVFMVVGEARREALACQGDERVDVVELDGIGPFYASDGTKVADTHAPCSTWYTHEQLISSEGA